MKYILYKSYDDTLYKMPAPRIHSQHMKRKQSTWKQKYNKFVESNEMEESDKKEKLQKTQRSGAQVSWIVYGCKKNGAVAVVEVEKKAAINK